MHPNQFFNHVTMLDESFIPGGAQALLASAHPKNFLPVPVRLPVYRIKIRFQTGKGVCKTAEKYAVLPPAYDNPEFIDEWLNMFLEDYKNENKRDMISLELDGFEKLGNAVLTIG